MIVNSVPKSGTHLVEKALRLLGISTVEPLFISSATAQQWPPRAGESTVRIGVGMPVEVSAQRLAASLKSMPAGQVATAHMVYSREMQDLLESCGERMLLALRDPRDVAVSLAFHIANEQGHRLHTRFAVMSENERLMATIRGCGSELESVGRRFETVVPWGQWRGALLVRFEDLVGSAGGGNDTRQEQTLAAICAHAGRCVPSDLGQTARKLFGSSATFRRGTTGQWRSSFTPEHQCAFDEVAPGLLQSLGYA